MGTVLPGQESDVLKLPGQQRDPPGWGAGNRAMPPTPELRHIRPACRQPLFFPSTFSLLPPRGRRPGGWGPERKSSLFLLLMFSLERGFSCVHVPDLSQPRSSGFRTTVWTAAQAEVIRYRSRTAAAHAQGGPCCPVPQAWALEAATPSVASCPSKQIWRPVRGWENSDVAPAYNLFNCASKGRPEREGLVTV